MALFLQNFELSMEIKNYKKFHRKRNIHKKENIKQAVVKRGFYGLKVLESGVITPKELETARRILTRLTKRTGKIFINVVFKHPLTKKPLLSRMGKGSGGIESWISYVKKGKVIIEVKGISKEIATVAFKAIQYRVSVKVQIIEREIVDA